jgi:NAD-reducing hydrogenase large subunit
MTQTITIDPVTRLEGHGKITIQLNGAGRSRDAHFHVTQVRGFEKFSEGRPFYEMPSLMARICGICPVSHLIASAKACEAIMSVRIPHTAAQLRRMLNLAQMVQSHALSFFYLASPDLLLGMESDPAARNIFGVVAAKPQLGRAGIALRRFGQHIIELLGNKRIHPGWVIPGGVTEPLAPAKRDEILAMIPEAYANIGLALAAYKQIADTFRAEIEVFANFPTNYLGLINEDESIEFTDGALRLIGPGGHIIEDGITANRFTEVIGEAVEPYSYTKFAYYKPLGYPKAAIASARSPASTSPKPWARRKPTRNSPSSSNSPRPRAKLLPLSTTRASSTCSTASKRSSRSSPTRSFSTSTSAPPPASTALKAQARPKPRAARSCTTTKSTKTASSPGPTWSSPPARTTTP